MIELHTYMRILEASKVYKFNASSRLIILVGQELNWKRFCGTGLLCVERHREDASLGKTMMMHVD